MFVLLLRIWFAAKNSSAKSVAVVILSFVMELRGDTDFDVGQQRVRSDK
jgi:hypothetical protein